MVGIAPEIRVEGFEAENAGGISSLKMPFINQFTAGSKDWRFLSLEANFFPYNCTLRVGLGRYEEPLISFFEEMLYCFIGLVALSCRLVALEDIEVQGFFLLHNRVPSQVLADGLY